jgi:hypothetical protein
MTVLAKAGSSLLDDWTGEKFVTDKMLEVDNFDYLG